MYPVSDAFLQAVQENTRNYRWTGQITTKGGAVYPFVYEDIVKGSGYIAAQCCGSAEIELGTVYAAEMGITLFSQIDRYTLEGAEVRLSYHLRLADGSFEEVPMGIFEVSEANRTAHCLELKAYDYMLRFEKSFNGFETVGTAWAFLDLCCKTCAVGLAHTQAEIEAMPNGTELLSIYPENDIETYRDVLYFVGQVLGGFFCINREGKLELRKYGTQPVMEVKSRHRFTSSFSDFITRYTAVSSTNLRTQTAEYYALEPDDGLTMNLAVNPLLQFGLEETREQLCRNILADISVVSYVPFDSSTIGNPALDLGDVLTFTGGQADGSQIACITSSNCKIGGKHTLKCVGKNPRLAQAKSKNDKNISGLLNQIEAGKIGIHTFTNASAYTVAETNVRIISIEFAAKEETHVQFFGQVLVDVSAGQVSRSASAKGRMPKQTPGRMQETAAAARGQIQKASRWTWSFRSHGWRTGRRWRMSHTNSTIPRSSSITRWRPGGAGSTSFPCTIRLTTLCRTSRTPSTSTCGWRAARRRLARAGVSPPSAARAWLRARRGTAPSRWRNMCSRSRSGAACRQRRSPGRWDLKQWSW